MGESSLRTKVLAGAGLSCMSSSIGILYKVSQTASGGFKYSTASAVCIAEAIKFTMSMIFHIMDPAHRDLTGQDSRIQSAITAAKSQLSWSAARQIWLLAFLYAVNNQLAFIVYTMADPGSIYLAKSASTFIVAALHVSLLGKSYTLEQWAAMMLQCVGMVIVQYNPCTSGMRYQNMAYVLMGVTTLLTAITAVRNEYMVKNFKIDLNVQNATLYVGGMAFNGTAFLVMSRLSHNQATIGFFEGYTNPLALAVVFANALMGIAITVVYKYADAVIKSISTDVTATFLCCVSTVFFGLHPTPTLWCGVFVIIFSVHLYTEAMQRAASSPQRDF